MAGGSKIATNTAYLIMSSILSLGISIVTTSIIARSIGPELYGRYTFGLNYILLFSVLSNLGIEALFIRETAKDSSFLKNIVDVLHLKSVIAILTIVAIVVSVHVLQYPDATKHVIYILCIGLFFQVLYESMTSLYISQERIHINAITHIVFRIFGALFVIGSVYSGIGFVGIVASFSIANALIFCVMFFIFQREYRLFHFNVDINKWKDLVKRGVPFYISALLTMLYFKINVIILSKLVSEEDMGIYMAALTLVESLMFLSAALNTSVFPAFSRMYGDSADALKITYQKLMKYLIIITTGVSVGTILVAKQIILLIYGDQFLASEQLLQVLIFFWVLTFFSEMQSSLLFSMGKETLQVKIMGFACVLNFVLSFVLIYQIGVLGAAYSLVATELVAVSIITFAIRKNHLKYHPDSYLLRLLLVTGAMIVVVKPLLQINVFVAIAGGAVCYITLLFLLRVFSEEDILDMKSFVGRKVAHEEA